MDSLNLHKMMYDKSEEQDDIINNLKNHNITVNAIAGSGKTHTIINCVRSYPELSFLIITYNKALQLDTKEKLTFNSNAEVHTYHSLCTKYYDTNANTDFYLVKSLPLPLKILISFDVLILDEAQDIKIIYYDYIIKILQDMKINRLCLFGDFKQNIYFKLGSTTEYLLNPTLFNFQIDNWINLKLTTSFRCSKSVVNLVNGLMNIPYMKSNIPQTNNDLEIIYFKTNTYPKTYNQYQFIENKIEELHNLGYRYDQMMILFPSFRYYNVRVFINSLQNSISHINIIALTNINVDTRSNLLLKNKIIISSVHSSKGLERDIVILLPFNESFNDMIHHDNKFECSNILYVALTRAKKRLILYKNIDNMNTKKKPTIPLIIENNILEKNEFKTSYVNCSLEDKDPTFNNIIHDIKQSKELSNETIEHMLETKYNSSILKFKKYLNCTDKKIFPLVSVSDYLSFRSIEYFLYYQNKFVIKTLYQDKLISINKEAYNVNRNIYEDTSSILGLIIPMYIELLLTRKINMIRYTEGYNSLFHENDLKKQIDMLVKITIKYCITKETMFTYKKYQVPSNIIAPELFIKIVKVGYNFINELNKENDYELLFEEKVYNENMKGSIDLLMKHKNQTDLSKHSKDIIIEFKVTTINDISNYIQLFLYGMLYCETNKKSINDIRLIYVNLSMSIMYELDFSEYYEELKEYIYNDINTKNIETKKTYSLIDYIAFIKSI